MKQPPANSYLLESDDLEIQSKPYSKILAQEDLSVLLRFFVRGYGGYAYLDRDLVRASEERIKALPNWRTQNWEELCKDIAAILSELPDGHLDAKFYNQSCQTDESDRARKPAIGPNIAHHSSDRAYKVQHRRKGKVSISVVGIERFPAFDDPLWKGFEDTIVDLKNHAEALVIDLRGNSGGDDSRGMQLVSFLKGSPLKKSDFAIDHDRTTPEASVLMLNKLFLKSKQSSSEVWKRYRTFYEDRLMNPPQSEYVSNFGVSSESIQKFGKPYTGKIFVLADSQCGSSGESTLQAIKSLGNAQFLGQRTAGVTHFGNQGLLILPHSRIRVSMSTKFIEFKDGTFVEKIGHTPDLEVADGRDALEEAIQSLLR